MPSKYEGLGIECIYPDNWKVREETDAEVSTVSIESPDAAFFSISRHPLQCSAEEVLAMTSEAMEEEYDGCEVEDVESGLTLDDSCSVEIRFFLLDMLVVVRLRAFSLGEHTYLVEQQAEDREYTKMEAVFDAMLETMIQSIDKEHGLISLHGHRS